VADDKRDAPRPFDVRTVEYLLKLMTEHDLAEIDLKEGDKRIQLRKGSAIPAAFYPASHPVTPVQTVSAPTPAPPATNSAPATASSPPTPAKNYVEIKSPMVGVFYTRPDPKKPEFVTKGSKVSPKTVVCTIEAMKIYNEVQAECSGTIVEVCKQGGDAVEYGDVLFRVEPS
jgi:acetyl-CoA carboxylase biotin carboxyl carrier protein